MANVSVIPGLADRDEISPEASCGAGGNRTPVHQAENARATTIPDFEADATSPAGRLSRLPETTTRLSVRSAVFHAVSGLSNCHPPLLLPGCGGSAPCAISGHDVSSSPNGSGGESELLIGNSLGCPV